MPVFYLTDNVHVIKACCYSVEPSLPLQDTCTSITVHLSCIAPVRRQVAIVLMGSGTQCSTAQCMHCALLLFGSKAKLLCDLQVWMDWLQAESMYLDLYQPKGGQS